MDKVYGLDPVASGPAEKIEILTIAESLSTDLRTLSTSGDSGAEMSTAEDIEPDSSYTGKVLKKGPIKVDKFDLLIENLAEDMALAKEEKEARQAAESTRQAEDLAFRRCKEGQIEKLVDLMDKFVTHMVDK